MGQRELLLLLGAITIFGTAALNVRRFMVDQDESMLQRQFEVYAVSLAQSYIEEAKVKDFDANATDPASPDPNDFTNPPALGPEVGETYASFNDVDDYEGFSKIDSTSIGEFNVAIQARYVQDSNPNLAVNNRTFYKKIMVTVTHDFLPAPITLSNIFGYQAN
ncbi:MAG: hypothetical protein AAB354_01550 [candidate division KSB1 bacterium]